MLTSESYKQLSDRCAQLAIASSAPGIAQALMATALGS
jgi:biopolymer transport protein ExbB/TolQ